MASPSGTFWSCCEISTKSTEGTPVGIDGGLLLAWTWVIAARAVMTEKIDLESMAADGVG